MQPADLSALKRIHLFTGIGDATLRRLTSGGLVQHLPPGAILFQEGDTPEFLHVVLSGRVALGAMRADRREAVIEIFAAGEVMIAPAVVLDLPYLMSARVADTARVAMIPAAEFRRALGEEISLARAMVEILARHWRGLIGQIKELKLKSATERIGTHLLGYLASAQGPQTIRLAEDRRTLASRLGMSPESLSRALMQLRQIDVTARGRTVVIADPEKLRALCRDESLDSSPAP